MMMAETINGKAVYTVEVNMMIRMGMINVSGQHTEEDGILGIGEVELEVEVARQTKETLGPDDAKGYPCRVRGRCVAICRPQEDRKSLCGIVMLRECPLLERLGWQP